mgnify:CR=1 FL=1|jgi:methyl-accepting chemotaxis protein
MENFIEGLFASQLSTIVFSIISFTFLYSTFIYLGSNEAKAARFARTTPSILVSIGIFGTFLGIFLALLDFDVDNINDSIPDLLEGLKFAFATSIEGLFFGLLFRTVVLLKPKQISKEDADVTDLLAKMTEVKDALTSENETSVVTQIQKFRADSNDNFRNLKNSFDEFAKQMSENNMKALIEAIQKVMEDFNAKINDQLGESFKELSNSVQNLVEWQKIYKEQLEEVHKNLKVSTDNIEKTGTALNSISESMKTIPDNTEKMKEIIYTVQNQIENLDDQLSAFSEMRSKAIDAMPKIEKNLDEMTSVLNEKVSTIVDQVSNSSEKLDSAIQNQLKNVDEMIKNMGDAQQEALKEINDTLLSQIKGLDESMEKEVTRIIELMGTKLSSLSEKFVNDYTPLTNNLSNLINSLGSIKTSNKIKK